MRNGVGGANLYGLSRRMRSPTHFFAHAKWTLGEMAAGEKFRAALWADQNRFIN